MKTTLKFTLTCAAIAVVAGAALAVTTPTMSTDGYAPHTTSAPTSTAHKTTTHHDWTYMPCSAWATQEYPTIPKYTHTNACVTEDGTLSYAPHN